MIKNSWFKIETDKFPILPGEEDEVVNEGMYGKALCLYLEENLPLFGLDVNFYCAEDWGWWVDVTEQDFTMGLLIYAHTAIGEDPWEYIIGSSVTEKMKWSWKKFRKEDISKKVYSCLNKVEKTLNHDEDISSIERYNEFPN